MKRGRAATIVATLVAAATIGGIATVAFIWSGVYDVSSNTQHTQPVYSLLEFTMHRSVARQARGIDVPPLGSAAQLARGAACYRDKCLQCHGAPGVAQGDIGRSMQPLPGPLVDAAARWQPQELYWLTRNGIRMSGMPAWEYRLADGDIWAVVAFMERLPALSPTDFAAATVVTLAPACAGRDAPAVSASASVHAGDDPTPPDAARGQIALTQYACVACHNVPGVTGPLVHVGPPLAGMATRQLIAGTLPHSTDNMVRWIRDPQAIDPLTAMPNLGVTDRDARDIAAYLETLR